MQQIDTNTIIAAVNASGASSGEKIVNETENSPAEEIEAKSELESSDGSMGFGLFD